MSPQRLCLYLTLALTLLTHPAFAAPRYRVTDLGILPGGKYVYVTGINNKGQVVGWVKWPHTKTRGFLWDGRMHDLGTRPDFPNCKAFGINDHAQIVGQYRTDQVGPLYGYESRSFVWENGKRTDLPKINFDRYTPIGADIGAMAINNQGQILGVDGDLLQNGVTTKVGLYSVGINDAGQAVGQKLAPYAVGTPGNGPGAAGWHPFLWKDGKAVDLGLFSGAEIGEASGLNAQGHVVGWMDSFMSPSGNVREESFLWNGNKLLRITAIKGYSSSRAYGINAWGQVVGKCIRYRGYAHAYCWQNGKMTDLNTVIPKHTGWVLEAAYGINGQGQIIGVGTHDPHHFRAFLLTPQH